MGVSRSEEKAGQFKVKVDFALILRISEMMAVMGDMMHDDLASESFSVTVISRVE